MSTQLNEDDYRHLTPEERAALEEDDYDEEADNAAALAAATNAASVDADKGDEDEGAPAAAAPAPAAAPAAPAQAPASAPAAEADPAVASQEASTEEPTYSKAPAAPAPAYVVELPDDFEEQQKANKQARADLKAKYNSGELDSEEYEAEQERLDEQRLLLLAQSQRAEISREMTEQAQKNAWVGAINSFFDDAATNGKIGVIDYRKDPAKQADLDAMVKGLAAANPDKPMEWYLYEGHKRVAALHQVAVVAAPAKADVSRKPALDKIAPNLAHVSGASGDGDAFEDEFAALDKLSGMAAERALASLSPQKQALYLQRN